VTCWLVIPVKQPDQAKGRLAGVLSQAERLRLTDVMLRHVVSAAQGAEQVDHVALLGPSRLGLELSIALLADPGLGLNSALQVSLAHVASQNAERLIILFADLPRVTAEEVTRLATTPAGMLAIAPDRHNTGTNALSLPLPAAIHFTFAFGPDSFALHRAEAERLGIALEVLQSDGLARDVDTPEDLADAAGLMEAGG
jgi:2-phospho-L-lactate/phosphoenolpyruvate guanylyltransferase